MNHSGSRFTGYTTGAGLRGYPALEWFRKSGTDVLVLRFETEATWQACCDSTAMLSWGQDGARCISRRLQQLEAMTSLDDLAFMPFDSFEHPDGLIEIALDANTSLFVREVATTKEDGRLPATLVMISAVGAQTMTSV